MNKARRDSLKLALGKIETLTAYIEEIKEDLQGVLDEEEEAYDNLPESIQGSERGEQMQEYIEALEEAIDSLDEFDPDELHDPLNIVPVSFVLGTVDDGEADHVLVAHLLIEETNSFRHLSMPSLFASRLFGIESTKPCPHGKIFAKRRGSACAMEKRA